jgi:sugar phosphate permease
MAHDSSARPTRVRYGVMVLITFVAILLYLHRYCLSTADRDIKSELNLTEAQIANVLGAFFFTYALGQIPFGFLSDRYGPRKMLTFYMLVWSALTGFIGLARGYVDILLFRLGCGLFEAGAYPACAGIIRRWVPYRQRGMASGIVSLGGRLGGTITPKLTALLMVAFVVWFPTGSWRPVMVIYGLFGVALAIAFWWIYRDSPLQHPACNQAEAELILRNDPNPQRHDAAAPIGILLAGALGNLSLWLCSFVQFGINFGWVFLVTYLNRYLQEVHEVPIETRGTMSSLVIGLSLPALIAGGWLTDAMTRRYGQRWGRCLPLAISRFISAAAFCAVPFIDDPWTIVLLLGAVAFFSDLGLPAIWAFNMDVGGRNVGFVLGWGNMWGNLGAALSPILLNQVVEYLLVQGHTLKFAWDAVFITCGVVFIIVGVASLGVDATQRVASGDLPPHIDRALQDEPLPPELPVAPTQDREAIQKMETNVKLSPDEIQHKREE